MCSIKKRPAGRYSGGITVKSETHFGSQARKHIHAIHPAGETLCIDGEQFAPVQ